jgi:hypothetical protein
MNDCKAKPKYQKTKENTRQKKDEKKIINLLLSIMKEL